ncbi:hypothetical protein GGI12_005343, partial [Dipsacomyces acuminosporus]
CTDNNKDWDISKEEILLGDISDIDAKEQDKPNARAKSKAHPDVQRRTVPNARTEKVPAAQKLDKPASTSMAPPSNITTAGLSTESTEENAEGEGEGGELEQAQTEKEDKGDDDRWRALTLNYNRLGAGYNSETESQAILPQLKAQVGDKVGYAKRQKAIQLFYEQYLRIDSGDVGQGRNWVPAMHAVEREQAVYKVSAPGTYHVNLVNSLRQLKRVAEGQTL